METEKIKIEIFFIQIVDELKRDVKKRRLMIMTTTRWARRGCSLFERERDLSDRRLQRKPNCRVPPPMWFCGIVTYVNCVYKIYYDKLRFVSCILSKISNRSTYFFLWQKKSRNVKLVYKNSTHEKLLFVFVGAPNSLPTFSNLIWAQSAVNKEHKMIKKFYF